MNNAIKTSDLVWTTTTRQMSNCEGIFYVATFKTAPLGDCAEILKYEDGAIVLRTDAGAWGFRSVKAALASYNAR